MEIDLKKIISAVRIKISPTEEQKELALKRLEVCNGCEFRSRDINNPLCRCLSCGCFINAKVFTDIYSDCPQNKWSEVDKPYFKVKNEKTLI